MSKIIEEKFPGWDDAEKVISQWLTTISHFDVRVKDPDELDFFIVYNPDYMKVCIPEEHGQWMYNIVISVMDGFMRNIFNMFAGNRMTPDVLDRIRIELKKAEQVQISRGYGTYKDQLFEAFGLMPGIYEPVSAWTPVKLFRCSKDHPYVKGLMKAIDSDDFQQMLHDGTLFGEFGQPVLELNEEMRTLCKKMSEINIQNICCQYRRISHYTATDPDTGEGDFIIRGEVHPAGPHALHFVEFTNDLKDMNKIMFRMRAMKNAEENIVKLITFDVELAT